MTHPPIGGNVSVANSPWTGSLLDEMRRTGDPPADSAISDVYASGQAEHVRQVLREFGRNSAGTPPGLPESLRVYFDDIAVLPEWADPALVDRGSALLGRYQPQMSTVLLCASLPLCYSCADGAQVLGRSQRLTSGVYRRLMETSQFLVDVLEKGGLGENAHGLRSAQKIRLLHATMRYHLSRDDEWNPDWGIPVNQEDLAGTLMSFSVVVPRGLHRLGIDLTVDERNAFFHTWQVIGHVMGVDSRLNPTDFDDGAALFDTILRRQQAESEAGTILTEGVLDFIREVLPGPAFAGVGPTLIRHLAGDETADLVQVPPSDAFVQAGVGAGSGLTSGYDTVGDTVPPTAELAGTLGTAVFKGGLRLTNSGRRYEWQVPTGLTPSS
ncbi:DUF2236 domain-containing protein [Pseudonocardia sp. C8]|nr:DUF2236 domain-containing protein [Pseudonocardia sp. C8]